MHRLSNCDLDSGDFEENRAMVLLVTLQFSLAPVVAFAIGIERALLVPVDCLQRRGAGKIYRLALFG
jgi:hypothetical protein